MMDSGEEFPIPVLHISRERYNALYAHFNGKDIEGFIVHEGKLKTPPVDIELLERKLNIPYEAWKNRHR